MNTTRPAIWWIHRDLRTFDNPALTAALSNGQHVLPLFILDNALLGSRFASDKRAAFMFEGLRALQREIKARGGTLLVRRGRPLNELSKVLQETGAIGIYAEHDYSYYARTRDAEILEQLPLTLVSQPTVAHPGEVLTRDGQPYTVFTPFSKQWKSIIDVPPDLLSAPDQIPAPAIDIESDVIPETPSLPEAVPFGAGETAGRGRLDWFTNGDDAPIYSYEEERDRLDLDSTSRLSPYLRFGMISARQAVSAAMRTLENARNKRHAKSAEAWLDELIWREFYVAILYHFPGVRHLEFQEQYRGMKWENIDEDLRAWSEARTGYPVVDACMRQLHSEGWMHNRGRMITASFLIKHLLVDWRRGEAHFMNHLIDGDPASNNGGWQWVAGTGTDAAPYFRIFNPILQSKRHDPEGAFIRRWLPELRDVPDQYLHEPWKMPEDVQRSSGCEIPRDYPEPIIEHSFARQRALEAYKRS